MSSLSASNHRIDADRLWSTIHEIAEIGPGVAGGSNRQTVTDADAEGRALFQRWCEDAGLTMGVDRMGTMFMTREGTDPDAAPVYVGSHLDTQPTGGRYDGVLGVLAGLEIVRTLNDLDIKTKHPIVVTNWTNEEGTRFAPAMMASGVFAGVIAEEDAYAKTDAKGLKFGDELKRIGWQGDEKTGDRKMHAFLELHIEQGPILEDREQGYRRRHPRPGSALDRMHGDGQGEPHRFDTHADAQERGAAASRRSPSSSTRSRWTTRPTPSAPSATSMSIQTRATSFRARSSSPSTSAPTSSIV